MAEEYMSETELTPAPGMPLTSKPVADPKAAGEDDEAAEAEKAAVLEWQKRIRRAREHKKTAAAFKQMRSNMDFARGLQWPGQKSCEDDRYTANIIKRWLKNTVSAQYAKNPKVVAKRRPSMDFAVWDEKPDSLAQAVQQLQMLQQVTQAAPPGAMAAAAQQPNPQMDQLNALIQDVQAGLSKRVMLDRVSRTLEILFQREVDAQEPEFKGQMKRMLRRAKINGVSYVSLGFQRQGEAKPPSMAARAGDEALVAELAAETDLMDKGEIEENSAGQENFRALAARITSEQQPLLTEGLIFGFPRSTSIIVHENCTNLAGFENADFIAEEAILSPEQVKTFFKVDVESEYTAYYGTQKDSFQSSGRSSLYNRDAGRTGGNCCVWMIQDKKSKNVLTIIDGYCKYVEAPAAPDVDVAGFWTIFAFLCGETEHEDEIYPQAEVADARSIQIEYNRLKESKRQHRIANVPLYAGAKSAFPEKDRYNLAGANAHDVLMLEGMGENDDVNKKLQMIKKHPVDPNLYEEETTFNDFSRVMGAPDFQLGSLSGATATEVNEASASGNTSTASDTDDLDDFLSLLASKGGQILLREMSPDSVKRKVGIGAVWPQWSREEILSEIYLETVAGSSGRPNQAKKAAVLERLSGMLQMLPGVRMDWLAKQILHAIDDDLDITDAYLDGLPSMTQLNGVQSGGQPGRGPGGPQSTPGMQGGQGAKSGKPRQARGGPGGEAPAEGTIAPSPLG